MRDGGGGSDGDVFHVHRVARKRRNNNNNNNHNKAFDFRTMSSAEMFYYVIQRLPPGREFP